MKKLAWIWAALIGLWALPASAQSTCETDEDCEGDLVCEMVGAVACGSGPCNEDGECEPDPDCQDGPVYDCVEPPCQTDSDCDEGERCVELDAGCPGSIGAGTGGASGGAAGTPGGAPPDDGEPAAEEPCEPETYMECVIAWEAPCAENAECGEGFECNVDDERCELVEMECTEDTQDDDCPTDWVCGDNPEIDCGGNSGSASGGAEGTAGESGGEGTAGESGGGAAGESGGEEDPAAEEPACDTGGLPEMVCMPEDYDAYRGGGFPLSSQGGTNSGAAGDGAGDPSGAAGAGTDEEADDSGSGESGGKDDSGCGIVRGSDRPNATLAWLALVGAMLVTRRRALRRR